MILNAAKWTGLKLSVSNPKYINGDLVSFIKGPSKQNILINLGLAKVTKVTPKNECVLQLQEEKEVLNEINKAVTKIADSLINYCISKSNNIWDKELSSLDVGKKYIPILINNKIKVNNNTKKKLIVGDVGELIINIDTLYYSTDQVNVGVYLVDLIAKKQS